MDSSQLAPRGYAQVSVSCNATTKLCQFSNSKGDIGIQRTDAPENVYCFDLAFTPKTAVASAHINNNATVGTVVASNSVPGGCPAGYRDAAAVTYGANEATSPHHNDINFQIVFI